MKVWIYHSNSSEYVEKIINELKKYINVSDIPSHDCDCFLSLQMGNHNEIIKLHNISNIPIYTFVWDCYEWIFDHNRGYDWNGYGNLCKNSDRIFVPSEGQRLRLLQHWNIELDKSYVIPAYAQFFDYNSVEDLNYVCNPLREIPDRHLGWIEKACKELDIPYEHGGRKSGGSHKNWETYKDFIGKSSFIVCPWYEASTGGMSLLEGYAIGKDVLVCNSPYMGAKDYFNERANYFEPTYQSLKDSIHNMWINKSKNKNIDLKDRKLFCDKFTLETFCKNLINAIQ